MEPQEPIIKTRVLDDLEFTRLAECLAEISLACTSVEQDQESYSERDLKKMLVHLQDLTLEALAIMGMTEQQMKDITNKLVARIARSQNN